MWFIFLIVPTAITAASSLFGATRGMAFVVTALGLDQWQRRRGYRLGEGQFTERENNGYYKVDLNTLSDHDLSARLGDLAAAFPKELAPYAKRRYDFTKSEGEMLRAVLAPVLFGLSNLVEVYAIYREMPDDPEALALVIATEDNLRTLLRPVIVFFEQFPTRRTRAA